MYPLIGLTGLKQAGKSSVAKIILDYSLSLAGFKFISIGFAWPLKRMLMAMGLTHEQVHGDEKEDPIYWLGGYTPRYLMQTLGTDWGRNVLGADLWVRVWLRSALPTMYDGLGVVVEDVRFLNEANLIRSLGGVLWKINRGIPNVDKHPSELEIGQIVPDLEIDNIGSQDQLKDKVCRELAKLHIETFGGT